MSYDALLRHGSIAELEVSPIPSRAVSPSIRSVSPVPRAYHSPTKGSSERLFTPDTYLYPANPIYDKEAERREERARAIRERIHQQLNVEGDVELEKGLDSRSSSRQLILHPTQRKGLSAWLAPALVVLAILGVLILVIVLSVVLGGGRR